MDAVAPPETDLEDAVRRQAARLLRTARRLLKSEAEAQEAVREGFRAAAESGDPSTALSGCVRKDAVRRAVPRSDALPEETRVLAPLLPRFATAGHALPCAGPIPVLSGSAAPARAALDALPPTHRTAFVLLDVEGVGRAEAAGLLSIALSDLDACVHRARQALLTLVAAAHEPPI